MHSDYVSGPLASGQVQQIADKHKSQGQRDPQTAENLSGIILPGAAARLLSSHDLKRVPTAVAVRQLLGADHRGATETAFKVVVDNDGKFAAIVASANLE